MKLAPHFIVYSGLGPDFGIATSDPIDHFTDAAWEYSDIRSKGDEACVKNIDPVLGLITDVTYEAETKLRQMMRYDDWPAYLDPRDPEEIAQEAEIERRTERMLKKQMEAAQ